MVGWNRAARLVLFACLGGLLWTVGTATLTDLGPTLADGFVMVGAGTLLLGLLGLAVGWTFAGGDLAAVLPRLGSGPTDRGLEEGCADHD